MSFRRATTDRLAVRRGLVLRCCRLPPMYRYVAAAFVACMVCVAHLIVNQAFLPAQTTYIVTTGQHPSIVDDDVVIDTSRASIPFNDHAFDWAVSHGTGCDVMTGNDADHVVCYTNDIARSIFNFHRTFICRHSSSCVNSKLASHLNAYSKLAWQ